MAANNPNLPAIWHTEHIVKRGPGSSQYRARTGTAQSAARPTQNLTALMAAGQPDARRCDEVWSGRCAHPVSPPKFTHGDHPNWPRLMQAARRPDCPPELLDICSRSPFSEIQRAVLRRPDCPPQTVARLALKERNWQVRSLAIQHPNLPAEVLELLSHAQDNCDAVTANPKCPSEILVRTAQRWGGDTRVAHNVATHPNTPPELLRTIADKVIIDPDLVRAQVAANPAVPTDYLLQLYGSPDGRIRAGAARNPKLPPELVELAHDRDRQVREGAAYNPNCSTALLLELIQDRSVPVRAAAAANPNLPPSILAMWQLARDQQ